MNYIGERAHNFILACSYSLSPIIKFRDKSNDETIRKAISMALLPWGFIRYCALSMTALLVKGGVKHNTSNNHIAVVAIMKNEEPYVEEWVRYYRDLGCDVIIYNNDSSGDLRGIASSAGAVVIDIHGRKRQNDAYNDAITRYKNRYKYMMFFDGDEFIAAPVLIKNSPDHISLEQLLDKYFSRKTNTAGLGINWLIFGSSGLEKQTLGRVTSRFTHCAKDEYEWNQLIKSVVKPEYILGFVGPHLPVTLAGKRIYDLDGKRILLPRIILPQNRKIRLHHYFTKSLEEFKIRISRGMADTNNKRSVQEFYMRDQNDVFNDLADRIYLSYQ